MNCFGSKKSKVEKSERLSHTYESVNLIVVQADITSEKVDAIVNAANEHLAHGGGVAGAISSRGGRKVQEESNDYVRRCGTVDTGNVAVTGPGNLPCKYIIHAVGPVSYGNFKEEDLLLRNAIMNSYKKANELKLKSISIPAISSGIFGYPKPRCAKLFICVTKDFVDYLQTLDKSEQSLKEIRFCNFDSETTNLFIDELEEFKKKGNVPPELPEAPKKPKYQSNYSSWSYGSSDGKYQTNWNKEKKKEENKKEDSDKECYKQDDMKGDDMKEDDMKEDNKKKDDKDKHEEDSMLVDAQEVEEKKSFKESGEVQEMNVEDNEGVVKATEEGKNRNKKKKKVDNEGNIESPEKVKNEESEGEDLEAPTGKNDEEGITGLKDSCNSVNLVDDFNNLKAEDDPEASNLEGKNRKADIE